MKVALINPGTLVKWAGSEPLNLGYIASYLESKKFDVRIFDQLTNSNAIKDIIDFKPHIAGLTATTPLADDAYKIAKILKNYHILTVMGGIHASLFPEMSMDNGIDIVVRGYGEQAMADILEKEIISGIIEGTPPGNLDDIPKPARHLISMDFYLKTPKFVPNYVFVPSGQKSARIITSRGCAYKCTFCHNSIDRTRVFFHSPERVLEEIEELINIYNTRYFFFLDDNFLMKKSRLREICSKILSKGLKIHWACQATSNEIDIEMLPLMKKAGCRQVIFGFESGSQKILDILQKGTTVEKNIQALRKVKEQGMITQSYFLVGNPGETEEDLQLTRNFVTDNKKYLDSVLVSFLAPFPGTKLWNDMKERHLIPDLDQIKWSEIRYDTIGIPVNQELPPDVLQKFYFELLSLVPPKFSTLIYRSLSDPVGTLSTIARTDKKAIFLTAYSSLFKRKK
jgi:anaerobic magnesium-protoporphyrin IX monomethyl ester cyclase